jgi:LuxR family transcriptional regulator, maltose regulon positive regulatory protein
LSAVAGHDRRVGEYLRSEVLSRLEDEEVEFLARTSVLGRMCGPLCDAVLERTGERGDARVAGVRERVPRAA